MKNISLTNAQYSLIKALFYCVAGEEREILSKVFYNSSEKEIVATDGHVLRIEKIYLGENNFIFDKKDFKIKLPKNKKYVSVNVDSENVNYPNYQVSIPKFEFNKFENCFPISVNLDLLSKIDKSIIGKNRFVVFISTMSMITPIKIYKLSNFKQEYIFIGVIMPDCTKTKSFYNLKNSKNSQ